ncbi:MAG: YARHG domain-containing protein [Chitinophagaceae bacterium]|nr:YARHG domain-containing protein [Chitinophagaceae bacterium]
MKHTIFFSFVMILLLSGCEEAIKNSDQKVEDEVSQVTSDKKENTPVKANTNLTVNHQNDMLGFWVGYFRKPETENDHKNIYIDEGLAWFRENKINISIDEFNGNEVTGHSVVAGNYRPFHGVYKELDSSYHFSVSEPGDDRYDGKFTFEILKHDSVIKGTWRANNKIEIPERVYELQKKVFSYNPEQMLEYSRRYGNWEKEKKTKIEDKEEREAFGDFYSEFSAATELIYKINASSTLLTKKDVENLKKGDLLIIRNTIYARHGYSFKNRPLRVFFDAQSWYIPVHVDIKSDLTEIEKKNIELMLKYEKNAKEYYDSFGRG